MCALPVNSELTEAANRLAALAAILLITGLAKAVNTMFSGLGALEGQAILPVILLLVGIVTASEARKLRAKAKEVTK